MKINSVSVAGLFKVVTSHGDGNPLFLIADFESRSVYSLGNATLCDKDFSENFFNYFQSQQDLTPQQVPYEKINEVIDAERKLSEDNYRRIFERVQ